MRFDSNDIVTKVMTQYWSLKNHPGGELSFVKLKPKAKRHQGTIVSMPVFISSQ